MLTAAAAAAAAAADDDELCVCLRGSLSAWCRSSCGCPFMAAIPKPAPAPAFPTSLKAPEFSRPTRPKSLPAPLVMPALDEPAADVDEELDGTAEPPPGAEPVKFAPSDPRAPPKDPNAPRPRTLPKPDAPETPLSPRLTPLSCDKSSAIGSMASRSRSRSRSRDDGPPFDDPLALLLPADAAKLDGDDVKCMFGRLVRGPEVARVGCGIRLPFPRPMPTSSSLKEAVALFPPLPRCSMVRWAAKSSVT